MTSLVSKIVPSLHRKLVMNNIGTYVSSLVGHKKPIASLTFSNSPGPLTLADITLFVVKIWVDQKIKY